MSNLLRERQWGRQVLGAPPPGHSNATPAPDGLGGDKVRSGQKRDKIVDLPSFATLSSARGEGSRPRYDRTPVGARFKDERPMCATFSRRLSVLIVDDYEDAADSLVPVLMI